jgi:glutamate synthase (NADPH/NADH) small chain
MSDLSTLDTWPVPFPTVLKTSSSHLEGCERRWLVNTKRFIGENGVLTGVELVDIEWEKDPATGRMSIKEVGKPEILKVDYVFLALGFVHPIQEGLLKELDLKVDERKNVATDAKRITNVDKVFAAGDCVSGQSLVVRCIASGRTTAQHIDEYLRK